MAQTQKKSSGGRSSSSRTRSKSTTAKSRNGSARQSSATRSSPDANGQSRLESVAGTVTSGAKNAAETVGNASSKAKTGVLAGGAAAVGLAATAIATRKARSRPKVLGVSLPHRRSGPSAWAKGISLPRRGDGMRKQARRAASRVSGAAEAADRVARRVSKVAQNVREVSETAKDAADK